MQNQLSAVAAAYMHVWQSDISYYCGSGRTLTCIPVGYNAPQLQLSSFPWLWSGSVGLINAIIGPPAQVFGARWKGGESSLLIITASKNIPEIVSVQVTQTAEKYVEALFL